MFRRIHERLQAARLEWDVRHGKKTWGRVQTPARASIEAKVIRADGSVEDLGVISQFELGREQLAELSRRK